MNKKAILSWLSLAMLVATSACGPRVAAAAALQTVVATVTPGSVTPVVTVTGTPPTATATATETFTPPATDTPTATDTASPTATATDTAVATATDTPTEPPVVTTTPLVFPPPVRPLIPTEGKPSLAFSPSDLPPLPPLQIILGYSFPEGTPGWTLPIRVAAFEDISPDSSERFTPVGVVEIGANPETESESQIYLVNIDLTSRETRVRGQLVPVTPPDISPDISSVAAADTLDLTFQRIPQRLNPERTGSSYEEFQELGPATEGATIFADGICFVVKMGNGTGNGTDDDDDNGTDDDDDNGRDDDDDNGRDDDDDNGRDDDDDNGTDGGPTYIRYCSPPSGPNEPASPLSVMDNFPSQYAYLQSLISEVAGQFDLQDVIQMDEILSMQEDFQHLQDCASELTQEACESDIVIAPVTEQYFNQQFRQHFGGDDGDDGDDDGDDDRDDDGDDEDDGNGGDDDEDGGDDGDDRGDASSLPGSPFRFVSLLGSLLQEDAPASFEIAVMKVLEPIETSDGTIQPGDYQLDYWFDANGLFYAATITGVTTENTSVINQQIPAAPATFIDKRGEGPKQPFAQISACKLGKWCILECR